LALLEKSGFVIDGPEGELNSVRQDKRCPGLMHHHPSLRANFAQSQMVKEGLIILQVCSIVLLRFLDAKRNRYLFAVMLINHYLISY
jgi:hypothetical protein